MRIPVILLAGPTASGKTALACALADRLAPRLPVELVSVDSAQVFRDMNVGTAKPDAATLARYPHHLIDLISPEESYSAGAFLRDVDTVVQGITSRGHLPILVGGTMMYFKVLIDGLSQLPPVDPALRQAIETEAAAKGWPALHAELAERDPEGAARIEPRHAQRVGRALELVRATGKTLTELYAKEIPVPDWMQGPLLRFALIPNDRAALHAQINQRFSQMLTDGLVDEVARLRERYTLHPELPSMRCVGYRQAWDFIEGRINRRELLAQGSAATRQLAKRQLTWLRSLPFIPLEPTQPGHVESLMNQIISLAEAQPKTPPTREKPAATPPESA